MSSITLWVDMGHETHGSGTAHPEHPGRLGPILTLFETLPVRIVRWEEDVPVIRDPAYTGKKEWITKGDTYTTAYTADLLVRGKRMIEEAIEAMKSLEVVSFVLVRPPGHHTNAEGLATGFCHQNNIWVAVQTLKAQGRGRILILDWDAHHGDGTEDCVLKGGYEDVRFCSLHAYGQDVYPGSGEAVNTRQILNIPFDVGTESDAYMERFNDTVMPWILNEMPEVLLVSAGYDGHKKDPMNLLHLDEQTYERMSIQLRSLGCPVLFLLEGGYNPSVLGPCIRATLRPFEI